MIYHKNTFFLLKIKNIYQRYIKFNLRLTHPTVNSILKRMDKNGLIIFVNAHNKYFKKNIKLLCIRF